MLQPSQAIRLPTYLLDDARERAEREFRTVPKQVEYFYNIGKIALDNPDLPVEFIIDVLLAKQEVDAGMGSEFKFRTE